VAKSLTAANEDKPKQSSHKHKKNKKKKKMAALLTFRKPQVGKDLQQDAPTSPANP